MCVFTILRNRLEVEVGGSFDIKVLFFDVIFVGNDFRVSNFLLGQVFKISARSKLESYQICFSGLNILKKLNKSGFFVVTQSYPTPQQHIVLQLVFLDIP
eukprot:TRINITY_DN37254_c0_g1_i1.p2 TRINITY_DN37254_c0_g1~~TRINITY_DN37254_c0_g1_i1.p2  ORF type:complete len:100 (-),score=2.03 TRINITY_DN37254_c0_g1_i1:21-320(-)